MPTATIGLLDWPLEIRPARPSFDSQDGMSKVQDVGGCFVDDDDETRDLSRRI
ncbi:hypothetical protein SNOG_03473 [Parastagonospora nodorum SN15]|uniref:Uncharacterized protein n=1 Tax=Phaeosphaeria nodorum (strain SN15 / ATCC MYA-4574 / FGSC 10173) TaxID=321614 RepID=Q0UXP1_PHANO|nr:hypothetical protein SNOG_03473 [Parastagonospora nodorum SN15]EAT88678.1 hypothetical protein SNOG_03473 [Parastagonospora nodorum SN15]